MKMYVVMDSDGFAKAYQTEKEAVEDFNLKVVEECQVDEVTGGVVGDGDYDEASIVLASDIEIPETVKNI